MKAINSINSEGNSALAEKNGYTDIIQILSRQ